MTLIGTEPPEQTYKLWGVIQPLYTYDFGDRLESLRGGGTPNNGKYVVKNTIAPWYTEQKRLQFRRLRAGVRGRFFGRLNNPVTDKINYFMVFEAAPSLVTYDPFGDRHRDIALADLFLTFNHLPGARIQVGLFKNPGPEETLQPLAFSNDYIQLTDFTGRVYLERFSSGSTRRRSYGGQNHNIGTPVNTAYGFSVARDWGVQIFDSFRFQPAWDWSYAVKVGRGEAIYESHDHDHNRELYLYSSLEYYLPGGKGPKKHGIKFFGWYQSGERRFDTDPEEKEYDRIRWGLGCKALGKFFGLDYRQRFTVELLYADGMIFTSPAGNVKGGLLQYAAQKGNKSRGLTLDYGFYLKKWQFDVRYHCNDMLYKTDNEYWIRADARKITETTMGITYHFTPGIRMTANYTFRDAEAPNTDDHNVQTVVKSVKNRMALQFTWIL